MTEPWREQPRDIAAGWSDDQATVSDEVGGGYPPPGLVSIRFLFDAVRRCLRLWLVTGLVGLALGSALPILHPPPAVATMTLLLTHQPGDDPVAAMETDVGLATTHTVARRVVERLHLRQTPDGLLGDYTVTSLTDRILQISVTAPTDRDATSIATAVAVTFLAFRMEQVRAQQLPTRTALEAAQARVARLQRQVATAQPDGASGEDTTAGSGLQRAEDRVTSLQESLREQQSEATVMSSSRILDEAAPAPRSPLRTLVVDTMAGLVVGVVLGIGLVVARGLLSDRLWRRQAIAEALGVRVALSVRRVRGSRWWPAAVPRPWRSRRRERDTGRIVRYLRDVALATRTAKPVLAVVPIDDVRTCARVLALLAGSFAKEGRRVLVADLTERMSLGRLLGVREAGTAQVGEDPTTALVTVHAPGPEGPPEGRLPRRVGGRRSARPTDALASAWADADVVLTFVEVDPLLGGDHLRTWSNQAVAIVTAGRSSATRIHAAAELIRAAGVDLDGAVLLGADRTDETVGMPADGVDWPVDGPTLEMVGR